MSHIVPHGALLSLFAGYEDVRIYEDRGAGMMGIIAIHNTNLGPALGGCRRAHYPTMWDAFVDVARLARGMTYKAAMTDYHKGGLPLGGGKSILIPTKGANFLRNAQYRAMGRFVEELGGRYIVAEDVGTSVADVHEMRKFTAHACGEMVGHPYGGDPSPLTALGVLAGMKGAVRVAFGGAGGLEGKSVYVEGIGKVGFVLMQLLYDAGAKLFVSNRSSTPEEVRALERARDECHATVVSLATDGKAERFPDVEIYAPCAMGGTVSHDAIMHYPLSLKVIAGSANNVLLDPSVDGRTLLNRDIAYAPDYVINNRGLWDVHCQRLHAEGKKRYDLNDVKVGCLENEALIEEIMRRSECDLTPSNVIADRMAEAVFLKKETLITHT